MVNIIKPEKLTDTSVHFLYVSCFQSNWHFFDVSSNQYIVSNINESNNEWTHDPNWYKSVNLEVEWETFLYVIVFSRFILRDEYYCTQKYTPHFELVIRKLIGEIANHGLYHKSFVK